MRQAQTRSGYRISPIIPTGQGWLYLCAAGDLFSRQIVGYAISPYMSADLAKEALFMACQRRNPRKGVIFHTDRGSQYARHTFQQAISKRGFIPSMSRKGNCDDNTAIESFFHTGLPSTSYTLKQYLLSRFITRSTLPEQCFLCRVRFLSME